MDKYDAIALLLAADKEPAILEQEDYAQARELLDNDEQFAAWVEQERAFYEQQENILDGFHMPEAARERIRENFEEVLIEEGELIELPGFGRNLLTLAAATVLLFAGVGTLLQLDKDNRRSTQVAQTFYFPDLDAFRASAAKLVEQGLELHYQDENLGNLVAYLIQQKAPVEPGLKPGSPTIGCAIYNINGATVSLICMRAADGQMVHLFTSQRDILAQVDPSEFTEIKVFSERETRAWQDANHSYVLVAHKKDQKLGRG